MRFGLWTQIVLTRLLYSERISEPGDTIIKKLWWRSSGSDDCEDASFEEGGFCKGSWPCAHQSVSCLAGTGDFRIGLFDSITGQAGETVNADGFADALTYRAMEKQLSRHPFGTYRGYHFRIFPHVSRSASSYVHKETGRHSVEMFYTKNARSLFHGNSIPADVLGGFEAEPGEWSTLTMTLRRETEYRVHLSIELNNITYSTAHSWTSNTAFNHWNPNVIDTVAIMFPNRRRYFYVEWAAWNRSDTQPVSDDRAQAEAANQRITSLSVGDDEIDAEWMRVYRATQLLYVFLAGTVLTVFLAMCVSCTRFNILANKAMFHVASPYMNIGASGARTLVARMTMGPRANHPSQVGCAPGPAYGSVRGSAFQQASSPNIPESDRYAWLVNHQYAL
mmetsp:Transcript_21376/g.40811  ORF Transcript_21376/g.40811 Transcript_21376/m.40811 type:complete len:392 (+) Transcript_21376:1-1176(+)